MVGMFDTPTTVTLAVTRLAGANVLAADVTDNHISVFGYVFYPLLFLSAGLALACVLTIHRQPHLSETQKLKWLLFALFLPLVGPLAYWLRMRADKRGQDGVE